VDKKETDQLFVDVTFPLPLYQTFTYAVGRTAAEKLSPFGRRTLVGYCVSVHERYPAFATKPILRVVDEESLLPDDLVALARWMSEYYVASLGEVFEAMLPRGVRENTSADTIREARLGVSLDRALEAVSDLRSRAPKQAVILEALLEANRPVAAVELAKLAQTSSSSVTALARKGLLTITETYPSDAFFKSAGAPPPVPERLMKEQELALQTIHRSLSDSRFAVVLLHGVTGSGKTEVYLRAARETLDRDRSVLYLVPEIALTPQTVRHLAARFDGIAVFHSRLSDGERNLAWRRVRAGQARLVLGTRSAVFAPVRDLGLIVIDEEHESTFKQDSSPRYHARQVALARARAGGATVVLGSATHDVETYSLARGGDWQLARLPHRVEKRPLPPVQVVDLRYDKGHMRYGRNLSRELAHYVTEALSLGEQVLLFMNRRGFAATVHCPRCAHVFSCPNCAVAMTYHKKGSYLLCHYCLARAPVPEVCPECLAGDLSFRGRGTERIEHEISQQFPEARALRMDSDAAGPRDFYELAFEDFRNRQIDILVGTQVIAKGLDFPNVTLVGVISADIGLSLPDFRASERTFQLLSQVAGRAGRGPKGGRVVIQTYNPDALPVLAARTHDYVAYADAELHEREVHGYPPFTRLVQIVSSAVKEDAAARACGAVAQKLRSAFSSQPGVRILGPAPAPFARLSGRYRYHLLLKCPLESAVQKHLLDVMSKLRKGSATITVDVDPQTVL